MDVSAYLYRVISRLCSLPTCTAGSLDNTVLSGVSHPFKTITTFKLIGGLFHLVIDTKSLVLYLLLLHRLKTSKLALAEVYSNLTTDFSILNTTPVGSICF